MRRSSILVFLVTATAATAAAAQDLPTFPEPEEQSEPELRFLEPNLSFGPFHYVSMSLFPSLRSGFETHFPQAASSRFEFRVSESWVNNSTSTDLWQIHYEVLRSNVALSWALADDLRLDLGIESASRTGGTLDAVILGFHQAFGLAIGYRNNFARNENRIEIQPPSGGPRIVVDETDPQPYEQAALLTLRNTLTTGDEAFPAVAWSMSVRGNLAPGDVRRSGPFDLGASLGLVKQVESVYLYLGGNVAWFGREEFFGLKLKTIEWSVTAAVEWNLLPEFSLIGQYVITSGGAERLWDFSLPCHEIVAGFKWQPRPSAILEVAIVENFINYYNSPDFGVHAGITFRW